MRSLAAAVMGLSLLAGPAFAQAGKPAAASPAAYVDAKGVIRWRAGNEEVRLFGANYCAYSGSDYRMAALAGVTDRKAMIDADMGHFARMGWDGLRICSWGDWENADAEGNLVQNEHVDLLDYVIAKAGERGISILLTPIHTYDPRFADQSNNPNYKSGDGFSSLFSRGALSTDPKAIAAEANYVTQLLNHVNPYTGKALKDDPHILFVEMINEPAHNSRDVEQSAAWINTLVDAVRRTGSKQITFHNLSQDFGIARSIAASRVDGVSFGWYPSGLNFGKELKGNFLHAVDDYEPMLNPLVADKPRIVYEFDQADLNTGYLFPAIARTFRSVGAQFAAIFAYDLLETAPYTLSWQTHFVNLVHTPRQAMSGVIASEAMDRLPAGQTYGDYAQATHFGDFWVDYDTDASGLSAEDAYMNAGDTRVAVKAGAKLTRVAGVGSSPVVSYEGTGAYFLDKIRDGVWRLEVYPDQIYISEPFAQPQPDKVVSRLYSRKWPMMVTLPDLGAGFAVRSLATPAAPPSVRAATDGAFTVEPGVWLLTREADTDLATLPATVNRVGLREYRVNAPRTYADAVVPLTPKAFTAGKPAEIRVRFAATDLPDTLWLSVRPARGNFRRGVAMQRVRGDEYRAEVSGLAPGYYDYVITDRREPAGRTWPDSTAGQPGQWPFAANDSWSFTVLDPATPLALLEPKTDIGDITFQRAGAATFKLLPGETSAASALSLALPQGAGGPALYGAGLYIGDRIAARGGAPAKALSVRLKADGGARKTLDVLLIEKDGSAWRGRINATGEWRTVSVPLETLEFSRSLILPTAYPGSWNTWREGPEARAVGRINPADIERLEVRIYKNTGETADDDASAVLIASVTLD
jgi:hypothetical protein